MNNKYNRQLVRKDDKQLIRKNITDLDMRDKMDKLAVWLDYKERLRRRAEIPKLEAMLLSESYQQSIIEFHNNQLNQHKEQWITNKAEKDRLAKILAVLPEFEKIMLARLVANEVNCQNIV